MKFIVAQIKSIEFCQDNLIKILFDNLEIVIHCFSVICSPKL